ncbi:hypothetical protein Tco_0800596 [Tanacetum coccineum]|uniref:Uncharacterized protein n=1 Tax=Tanacetum coccineum TaxID=301880 RepID=A0ABQ4ZTR0_9ASTR
MEGARERAYAIRDGILYAVVSSRMNQVNELKRAQVGGGGDDENKDDGEVVVEMVVVGCGGDVVEMIDDDDDGGSGVKWWLPPAGDRNLAWILPEKGDGARKPKGGRRPTELKIQEMVNIWVSGEA